MKRSVAEEQKSCVFRFWRFTCTHTPPSFRSLYKQRGPGASFIKTGRRALQWLPGHIPVCCQMSRVEPWHFTRRRARKHTQQMPQSLTHTHTRKWSFKGAFLTNVKPGKIAHPAPQRLSLKTDGGNLSVGCENLSACYNQTLCNSCAGKCGTLSCAGTVRGLHNLVPGIV